MLLDGHALQTLISDVANGKANFCVILVYDVSRWGRFHDADESAYFEYICRRAGIQVAYCAQEFENDGSPVSTIGKGVKRAIAGEYATVRLGLSRRKNSYIRRFKQLGNGDVETFNCGGEQVCRPKNKGLGVSAKPSNRTKAAAPPYQAENAGFCLRRR